MLAPSGLCRWNLQLLLQRTHRPTLMLRAPSSCSFAFTWPCNRWMVLASTLASTYWKQQHQTHSSKHSAILQPLLHGRLGT